MAIQLQGNGGTIAEVDGTTWRALRVTSRPPEMLGAYSLSMAAATAAAPAAAANLVSFRWTDASKLALITRIDIRLNVSTASTVGLPEMGAYIARSFTVVDSGGTAVTTSGNQMKLRTSHATSVVGDMRFASAGTLTAGTRTLDTLPFLSVSTPLALGSLAAATWLAVDPNAHPIVLAQNEGIVFQNVTAITAGIYRYHVSIDWLEVSSY